MHPSSAATGTTINFESWAADGHKVDDYSRDIAAGDWHRFAHEPGGSPLVQIARFRVTSRFEEVPFVVDSLAWW